MIALGLRIASMRSISCCFGCALLDDHLDDPIRLAQSFEVVLKVAGPHKLSRRSGEQGRRLGL